MLRSSQELPAAPRSSQQLHGALRSSPQLPSRANRSFHVFIGSGPLQPIVPFTFHRLWAIRANRSFHFLIGFGSFLRH